MSKQRVIKDEVWDDEWFYDLTANQKLVWFFLLTNPRSNIAGVYQLNYKWAANLLGLSPKEVETALNDFEAKGKIKKKNGWIVIQNFHRHQSNNPKVEAGVVRIIGNLPPEIIELLPMDSLSIAYRTLLNLTLPIGESDKTKKPMAWKPQPDDYEEAIVDADTGEVKPVDKPPKRQYKEVYDVFEEVLGKRPLNWTVNVTQQKAAENLAKERGMKAIRNALRFYLDHKDEEFCPQISSPADLDSKWSKLAGLKSKKYGG